MTRFPSYRMRAMLLGLFLLVLVMQYALFDLAEHNATIAPELAYLKVPYLVTLVGGLGLVELAIIAGWRLSSIQDTGGDAGADIDSEISRWANAVMWLTIAATVLITGTAAHATFTLDTGVPPLVALSVFVVPVLGGVVVVRILAKRYAVADKQAQAVQQFEQVEVNS